MTPAAPAARPRARAAVAVVAAASLVAVASAGCRGGEAPGATVAIVGIDSGDWDIIDPYIDAGELPNLARMRREGASARLTVDSAYSPVSWTSLATGVHPDTHGVLTPTDRSVVLRLGSDQIQVKRLWDIVGAYDKRSLVVDYWLTYPAYPIEGVLVAKGSYGPGIDIGGQVSAYPAGADETRGREIEPVANRDEMLRLMLTADATAIMDGWMQAERFDLLALPFYPVDAALHMAWAEHHAVARGADLSGLDPALAERIRVGHGLVLETLHMADELLGRALDYVGDDGYVMLVSDHGHTGVDAANRRLAISRVLLDGGEGTAEHGTFEVDGARITLESTHSWIEGPLPELTNRLVYPEIRVEGPAADEVVARLLAIPTDAAGPLLRERRHRLIPTDAVMAQAGAVLGRHEEASFSVFVKSGYHRVEDQGIFALLGPDVARGAIADEVESVDVAPTALWLLGVPYGEDMAGAPATAALTPAGQRRRPVHTVPTHEDGTRPWAQGVRPTLTPQGLEQMKALGYVE